MSAGAVVASMVARIVERFDPEQASLFGSHARGEARPDSDVDLLVVMPSRRSRTATEVALRMALADFPLAKDVLVASPADYAVRSRVPGTAEQAAALEGKVVYARG